MNRVAVVIPNLDGGDALLDAVGSLVGQGHRPKVVVVDNASTDGSAERAAAKFPEIHVITNETNLGYSGGVNVGLRWAIEAGHSYVGVFNDDAIAQPGWLASLLSRLEGDDRVGVVTSKVLDATGERFDSAGDLMTTWGIPIPRGRGQIDSGQYDTVEEVFAASGAACLFRTSALLEVGLFDEDFFAYFEDVDLSFRLRLAGWLVLYCPGARVHHVMHMTSARSHGFTTFQTMKNVPLVLFKNMPTSMLLRLLPRFVLAQTLLTAWAMRRGQGRAAWRGHRRSVALVWSKRSERRRIMSSRVVSVRELEALMVREAPPGRPDLKALLSVTSGLRKYAHRATRRTES